MRYTIRLYRAVRAQYASLTEPELDGALIERIGDDIQFETMIDSVRYRVLERNYAIFPQQSGVFTIPGVTYSAEVSTSRQSYGTLGSLRGRSRSVSLSSDDMVIEVKPIPAENNGWWLPAGDLSVKQSWKPDSASLEVGAPVTWTYTVIAEGLTATQLPDILPPEIDGVKFYPEKAKSTNAIVDGKLLGKRTQTVAVIATKPGEVTIPAIDINWWNIATDSAETLTVPSKVINVEGTFETQPTPSAQQPVVTENANPVVSSNESQLSDSTIEPNTESDKQLLYWQSATAVFVILWLMTLLWRRNQVASSSGNSAGHANDSQLAKSKASMSEQKKLLQEALKNTNAQQASQALIASARSVNPKIHSVSDICSRLSDESTIEALKTLERAKYSAKDEPWSAEVIKANLQTILAAVSSNKKSDNSDDSKLPPLHASDS